MHCDRYGLRLTTGSALACERYVRGCELLLTLYPGAAAAFDEAIAADPRFALAHVAKARVLQLHGDVAGARAALEVGRGLLDEATAREASHFDAFDRIINSPGPVALEAVLEHVRAWPLDALVLGTCASQFGLIGLSGLAGREQRLADLLDTVAGAYGEDWWFLAHHGMALSEVGRRAEARQKIGRSRAMRAENGFMAHAQAHVSYEDGEADEAAAFMRAWLPGYPREGALFGHLSWHLALVELERGEVAAAFGRYSDAIAAADYPGQPIVKLADSASFLWRAELAGHPRDAGKWQEMVGFARRTFPRAGVAIADWHVALVDAVAADDAAMVGRAREMAALAEAGRYPSGPLVPALALGLAAYEREDFEAAIGLIEPVLAERERIGGAGRRRIWWSSRCSGRMRRRGGWRRCGRIWRGGRRVRRG